MWSKDREVMEEQRKGIGSKHVLFPKTGTPDAAVRGSTMNELCSDQKFQRSCSNSNRACLISSPSNKASKPVLYTLIWRSYTLLHLVM